MASMHELLGNALRLSQESGMPIQLWESLLDEEGDHFPRMARSVFMQSKHSELRWRAGPCMEAEHALVETCFLGRPASQYATTSWHPQHYASLEAQSACLFLFAEK